MQGEIRSSRAKQGHRANGEGKTECLKGTQPERLARQALRTRRRGERNRAGALSEGGLVTHGYAGILAGKREREERGQEKEEPEGTGKRGGRKTQKGSA